MRTTIDIDDEVLRRIKRLAVETNQTIRQVIEDALRSDLARKAEQQDTSGEEEVITFRGSGVRPGVNLDSIAELLDIMDQSP